MCATETLRSSLNKTKSEYYLLGLSLPLPKIIKLKLETSLKSQALDWLKWRLLAILVNQML
jgi:hypothetical protein